MQKRMGVRFCKHTVAFLCDWEMYWEKSNIWHFIMVIYVGFMLENSWFEL